jgi:hypothetical protein
MASITLKTQRRQIQFVDECLDDTNRIVSPNVVVQALRQYYKLASILALNEPLHPVPPDINPGRISD